MKRASLLCAAALAAVLVDVRPAEACGGCFTRPSERSVVTDHRMALAVSPQQTVLWDQIRYAGDPREFAWVLPVRAGAKIEVSNDEWFAALDVSTAPVIYGPSTPYGRYGCGVAGCSSQESAGSSGGPGGGQVQIVSQSVVGPYETVTLRATDPHALTTWLTSHAYAIPPNIEPTIRAYVEDGFDFIALRLVPTCNERAMRPVRVVTPGADPTLPLRMVAAGIGAKVGITLYVITEGRWHPQNFPDGVIDDAKLRWDRVASKSNYDALSNELMGRSDGRTWHIEYAMRPDLNESASGGAYGQRPAPAGNNPGLADAYYGQCRSAYAPAPSASSTGSTGPIAPCVRTPPDAGVDQDAGRTGTDAGTDASRGDAGGEDAGEDDASVSDAAADAPNEADAAPPPPPDTGSYVPPPRECAYLDDLDVALRGLHSGDVWVTRMRALLPADALSAGDLRLEPTREQTAVTNVHYASTYTDEDAEGSRGGCASAHKDRRAFGSWVLAAVSAVGAVAWARRRTRR
jgi:hypothetical protein